ncbi:MAG: HAMP domain-containing sensor histidine kinase [Parcubacteria group bacterium]
MGWATDLRNKYRSDIFFRTEFNVISLQIAFAIVLSVLIAVSFNYLYKDILQTILSGIQENINNKGTFTSSDMIDSIRVVRAKNFLSFFSVAVSLTLAFSYIIAKLTLSPAREALKSQKRFVGDIAHELRTPLSVIKTNSEVALLDEDINRKIKKIFENNIDELDRVSGIINNLLTFNKLVHPERVQFVPVNLGDVIDTSIKKLEELTKKKEIKLTVKKTSPYTVFGNAIALEQIVVNIIKNAINYNNIGGSVVVTLEPDYVGNITLCVEDTGIGISQEDLVHIFEPFYRAERSRNRQSGSSSGLGLTFVSELVKLHSGRISVASRKKEGTVVTIVLPYMKNDIRVLANASNSDNKVSVDYLKNK